MKVDDYKHKDFGALIKALNSPRTLGNDKNFQELERKNSKNF